VTGAPASVRTKGRSAPLGEALLAAAHMVADVLGGRNLDDAFAAARLTGPLRGAVRDLAWGTLRRCGRGDFFLGRLIERPLRDTTVHALLLCALTRLEDRPEEAHTTVDQAVEAAARIARGKFSGLTNGVLRGFLRRRDELAAALAADETATLQHPRWWLDRLAAAFPDDWRSVAEAGNRHPPMCLRANRRRATVDACLAELAAAGIAARRPSGAGGDDAALLLDAPIAVERLPGFAEGKISVQDWGAQQAAPLLDARAGMRVLDACAAPGGKSGHLLERADIDLTALDADAGRAARVVENLDRLGLAAAVTAADCRDLDAWWDGRPFERILADVPCSASGVARRHPDIKWLRRPGDVAKFARQQAEILDALWRTLAPGGRMLYCTCSVFPEENGRQVANFADRHADAVRLPTGGAEKERQWLPADEHDGFYYALLEKRA
jgi:16S rRNA (cytosine967-C5)-methyltransferase